MYSRIETITPEIAVKYLEYNRVNRPLKPKAIKNYARDMKNHEWQLSPQGISFYENGDLADGQNRLNAIIQANVPVDMYVTYDVPDSSTIQDRGVPRSINDIFALNGINRSLSTNSVIGVINMLFALCGRQKASDPILIQFALDNAKMLCEAVSVCGTGSSNGVCRKAPIAAAAFCALYAGIKEDSLQKMFKAANSAFMEDIHDSPAIVLRKYIEQCYKGDTASRKRLFAVTTHAINDYSKKSERRKIYNDNVYPLFFDEVRDEIMSKYCDSYK